MTTKENVLHLLEENRGKNISGEQLAAILSLSRASIWKAIKELKKEGYQIQGITNKGYCLLLENDILSAEGIGIYLSNKDERYDIKVYKTLDSTNQTAKQLAFDGASHGTIVIAEEQTQGKGRMGRSFYSPSGSGIYMSILLRPEMNSQSAMLITTATSVGVCRAIEKVTGVKAGIKWVNDLYLYGKKICGILTEAIIDFETGSIDHVVLGIGINFLTNKDPMPVELKERVGSVFDTDTKGITRNRLIAEIIEQVMGIMDEIEVQDFIIEYRERSVVLQKEIQVLRKEEKRNARALDVDNQGGLVVQYEDGTVETLNSGEISIRGDF